MIENIRKKMNLIKCENSFGAGYGVNFNDIGGSFSGIIYGFANSIGTSTSILAPVLVGLLTKNVTKVNLELSSK